MSIITMMLHVVEAGAAPHLQQVALELAADCPPTAGRKLLLALATTPNLCEPVRGALEQHRTGDVRAAVWSRPDTDQVRMLEAARSETGYVALAAMIRHVQDLRAMTSILRDNTSKSTLRAVLRSERWDLPADLLAGAFALSDAGVNLKVADALEASGRDLSAIVVDDRVRAWVRLAACASSGTPADVIADNLERILANGSLGNGLDGAKNTQRRLSSLAERPHHPGMLAAFEAGRAYLRLAEEQQRKLKVAWHHWSQPDCSEPESVGAQLSRANNPHAVSEIWNSLSVERQALEAPVFTGHPDCPEAVFRQARQVSNATLDDNVRYGSLLWVRQSEDLFKEQGRKDTRCMLGAIHDAATCPWSPPAVTLASWALDVLIELTPNVPAKGQAEEARWVDLLAEPHFPKERLSDVPMFAISQAMNHSRRPGLTWVTQAVTDALNRLTPAEPAVHAALLRSGPGPMDSFLDYCAAMTSSLQGS